ncbi:MAG: DUF58 domain-containing protein [Gammaproteobacteria bacterium]
MSSISSNARKTPFGAMRPFSNRFKHWLNRRIPPQNSITLNQKSIFIFPTRIGFAFSILLLALLLAAINYENSLIFGLTFWLASVFFVTIFHTFRNLSGIKFELQKTGTGFVGEDIEFIVKVSRPENSKREGIQLGWPNEVKQWAELRETHDTAVQLFVNAKQRGWLNPNRLLIETYYPLGLLRAWTWIDLNTKAIIYPKPIFHDFTFTNLGDDEEGELTQRIGSDDFHDMRNYHPGDSPRHILWRSYARQDELLVKQFAAYTDSSLILDWHQLEGETELRLSRLTGMALNAYKSDKEFGLKLPYLEIKPNTGKSHLDSVLKALALYGLEHET